MADPTNPHDKFFRASMQNAPVAQAFFEHYLPTLIRDALDLNSFKLENSTYIDENLQETISDLVFTCRYNEEISEGEAKVSLLVEHQSTPDRLMPFRVYHYMFNMIYTLLKGREKEQRNDKLPVVYALVFYHGKPTPYPYSMSLADCFDDPLGIMSTMFNNPVPLIDVNQASDDEFKQQQLLGIMTSALKHSRDRDIKRYLKWLTQRLNSMDLSKDLGLNFVRTVLNYLLNVGNTADIEQFIKGGQRLPEPVRGEFMTIAEKLRAMGAEEGKVEGIEEVANSLLKEGVEPRFVARVTKLELAVVLKLQAQLKN
jgi:predicted transposase/invertase (TIGR01784 family)